MLSWWHNATYDIEDVLIGIRKPGFWHDVNETIVKGTGHYHQLNASINEVSTNYGRCYSIYLNSPLKNEDEYYTFRFDMSYHDELQIFVHEKYAEVGLLWSFWPVEPHSFTLKDKGHVISVVQEDRYKPIKYEYVSCIDDKEKSYSYPKCVRDWARQAFKDMFENNNRTGKVTIVYK